MPEIITATCFSLLLSLFAVPLPAQPYPEFAAGLQDLARDHHLPGLSVLVAHNDTVVFRTGLGYADVEAAVPATAETPYRIASLTKPIAATVLLQLRDEGRLGLDDTLKQFVPGYTEYFAQVRKYILANAPEYGRLVENYDFRRDDITIRHHLTHTAEGVPNFAFTYNGFLFGALSRVLEVRGERRFVDLLRERIFTPLGMQRSRPEQQSADSTFLAELAVPYHYADGTWQRSPYPNPEGNAGAGIISTVDDLALFDRALNGYALLPEASLREAWTPNVLRDGTPTNYGLGWFVEQAAGRRMIWHYGWQPEAYSAIYLKIPAENYTLIALANAEGLALPVAEAERTIAAHPLVELFLRTVVDRD